MPLASCQARSNALLADDAGNLLTEGYLLKQGEGGLFSSAAYKKRYFRLKNNVLSYYSEKTSGKASGTIALGEVSDVNLEESKGKVVLKLTTQYRVYTLSSEDEEILANWCACLTYFLTSCTRPATTNTKMGATKAKMKRLSVVGLSKASSAAKAARRFSSVALNELLGSGVVVNSNATTNSSTTSSSSTSPASAASTTKESKSGRECRSCNNMHPCSNVVHARASTAHYDKIDAKEAQQEYEQSKQNEKLTLDQATFERDFKSKFRDAWQAFEQTVEFDPSKTFQTDTWEPELRYEYIDKNSIRNGLKFVQPKSELALALTALSTVLTSCRTIESKGYSYGYGKQPNCPQYLWDFIQRVFANSTVQYLCDWYCNRKRLRQTVEFGERETWPDLNPKNVQDFVTNCEQTFNNVCIDNQAWSIKLGMINIFYTELKQAKNKEKNEIIDNANKAIHEAVQTLTIDWSFLNEPNVEKKEQHVWALQCAIHAASLLNNQSNIFEEVSLATLASTTPELMTALQEVKTIVLKARSVDESSNTAVQCVVTNGTELSVSFSLIAEHKGAGYVCVGICRICRPIGAGRAVLACLCPSVAADHNKIQKDRVDIYNKWQDSLKAKKIPIDEEYRKCMQPQEQQRQEAKNKLDQQINPLKNQISTIENATNSKICDLEEKKKSVGKKMQQQWFTNWCNKTPSYINSQHTSVCKSRSNWAMCTSCCHVWCQHSKCGHTGNNCPSCSRGHGSKPKTRQDAPRGTFDKEQREGEQMFQKEIDTLQKQIKEQTQPLQQKIREKEQQAEPLLRKLEALFVATLAETDLKLKELTKQIEIGCEKELASFPTPGGVAYVISTSSPSPSVIAVPTVSVSLASSSVEADVFLNDDKDKDMNAAVAASEGIFGPRSTPQTNMKSSWPEVMGMDGMEATRIICSESHVRQSMTVGPYTDEMREGMKILQEMDKERIQKHYEACKALNKYIVSVEVDSANKVIRIPTLDGAPTTTDGEKEAKQ